MFYKVIITLTPKPKKDITKNEKREKTTSQYP